MALTDDEINRLAEASARRTLYLLAQGMANQVPAGSDSSTEWLIQWINQCLNSSIGAVLDWKLAAMGLTGLPAKVDATPDLIAQKFTSGITLTVNTTKGN